MNRWTTEQRRAIEEKGNLIVSAAAGAGKTAVLTERVVTLVASGTPIDALLILTFTRAAASEMKERIGSALREKARSETDEKRRAYLNGQSLLSANASISTIHAFCARVVFRHFHLVGVSPAAATMDDTESKVLKARSAEQALGALAVNNAPAYRLLLRSFEREEGLLESLFRLDSFLEAQPEPERWLLKTKAGLTDKAVYEEQLQVCLREGQRELRAAAEDLTDLRNGYPPSWDKLIAVYDGTLVRVRGALLQKEPAAYGEALTGIPFPNVGRYPKDMTEEEKEQARKRRDKLKDTVEKQAERFSRSYEQQWQSRLEEGEALLALTELYGLFKENYEGEKRRRDKIDFNDLEHYCSKILEEPEIAEEYRARFAYIIVDEYQDSNRVQEQILSRICKKDNLFFVGDVKQSIYGFRMAEPSLFLEKLKLFHGEAGTRIDLTANFRSSNEVLTAVNNVFSRLMTADTGSILYDEKAALRTGVPQPEGTVFLQLFEKNPSEEDEEEETPEDAQAEAGFCANEIRRLVEQESYAPSLGEKPRPYTYGDFAVLLRSAKNAFLFARTLALWGIPCYAQLSGGYFESLEVMIFLNLLRVIDNRRQDIPLLSALCSAVGGYSQKELIALREKSREGELLDCLLASAAAGDGKAASFLAKIERWRQESLLTPMEPFVSGLLDETGLTEEMGVLPGGPQRQANLNALAEKARLFDASGSFGLHSFISYMDEAKKSATSGAAQTVASNVVRIFTVHKSKGLEFPAVFLCSLGSRFNRQDELKPLLLHEKLGMGLTFVDKEGIKRTPLSREGIRYTVRQEQNEEEMRVLYVAMTRAKRRLYLVGSLKNAQRALSAAGEPTVTEIANADGYLKWLLPTLKGKVDARISKKSAFLLTPPQTAPVLPPPEKALANGFFTKYQWAYPYAEALGLPNKTSVTALAREKTLSFTEGDLSGTEPAAAQRGTDVHALLEKLPLERLSDGTLRAFLQERRGEAFYGALRFFTDTPLFSRLCAAKKSYRELPFTYAASPDELWGEAFGGEAPIERVLLQGVIDACFLEEGGFVLLDYKTDHIGDEDPAVYCEKHRKQVALYAKALSALSAAPVKEMYVVLLSAKRCVRL